MEKANSLKRIFLAIIMLSTAGVNAAQACGTQINGPNIVCANDIVEYDITDNGCIGNAQNSNWTILGNGGFFVDATGNNIGTNVFCDGGVASPCNPEGPVRVEWTTGGVMEVQAPCAHPGVINESITVFIGYPEPDALNPPPDVCLGSTRSFTVGHTAAWNPERYTWRVPSGWRINGVLTGLMSIDAPGGTTAQLTAPTSFSGTPANIRVSADLPNCLSPEIADMFVQVSTGPPGTPGPIIGPNYDLCDTQIGEFSTGTYSTTAVATATKYEWEVRTLGGAFVFGHISQFTWATFEGWRIGAGSYTLRVKATNDCGGSGWRSTSLIVLPSSDPQCGGGFEFFSVSPNPASDFIEVAVSDSLSTTNLEEEYVVEMFNDKGKMVMKESSKMKKLKLRTNNLPADRYVLNVRHPIAQEQKHIIINK